MSMTQEVLKKIGLTSIEDMITEDFGEVGTPEREDFELSCDTFIIEEKISSKTSTIPNEEIL